jgi:glucosyl-dolichyl phosphate glucuronosyltransferase
MKPRTTVSICTWNRAVVLDRTLAQFARIEAPAGGWELVVVNNASTDDTAAVLERWQQHLPLRIVLEPKPGIAHARNTALAAARGDILVCADDDIRIQPDWLNVYLNRFERSPDVGLLAGPVRPWFEGEPPRWLSTIWPHVAVMYGECDYGEDELELAAPHRLPYGANYAVRRAAIAHLSFDARLGRRRTAGALGEETVMFEALLAQGTRGIYLPAAAVGHWIPASCQTLKFLRSRFEAYGKTCFIRDNPSFTRKGLQSVPRWMVRRALTAEVKYRLRALSGDPQEWIEPMTEASTTWGALKHCLGRDPS